MGADMVAICLHWPTGETHEDTQANAKQMLDTAEERIKGLTKGNLPKEYLNLCWTDVPDELDAKELKEIKKALGEYLKTIRGAIAGNNRDAWVNNIGDRTVLFTGGASWGDSPNDLWDAIYNTSAAGLFIKEKGVEDKLSEKYVKDYGRCPICGDSDIVGESINIDGDVATQAVSCSACGSSWYDWYKLQGLFNLYISEEL